MLENKVYETIIKPKLSSDVSNILLERGYLKESIGDYLLSKGYLFFPEQDLSLDEIVQLDKLNWVSDATKFTLQNRVVVPIRNAKGEVITLVGWKKGASKYLTLPSENFSKESHWFNINSALEKSFGEHALEEFKGTCVIVEGIFDALMLDYLGIPAIATMGSNVNHFKGELLSIFNQVLCMPDNDKVGKKALTEWKVPYNAKFLYVNPTTIKLGDISKSVKDVDDLVNYFDDDTVRFAISYYMRSGGRVSYLDL